MRQLDSNSFKNIHEQLAKLNVQQGKPHLSANAYRGTIQTTLLNCQCVIYLVVTVLMTLGYIGYQKFIVQPKANEAVSELNQAQYYFELALNNTNSD